MPVAPKSLLTQSSKESLSIQNTYIELCQILWMQCLKLEVGNFLCQIQTVSIWDCVCCTVPTAPTQVFKSCCKLSVQSLSCVRLLVTPWTAAHQACLSITNSKSLLKLMSIESVMPYRMVNIVNVF